MSDQINKSKTKEGSDNLGEMSEDRELIHGLRNCMSLILMESQLLLRQTETAGSEADEIKRSAKAIELSVKEMVALLVNR